MQQFNTKFIEKSRIVDCSLIKDNNLLEYLENRGNELESFNYMKTPHGQKNILVIGGGMSAEREVSLMSSSGIVKSLCGLGYHTIFADMGADIAQVVHKLHPDVVYNALHGTYGEDGCLAGLLNILRIPYTGPGVLASALAMNKRKSYDIFKSNNIDVADAIIVHKSDGIKQDPMARPYVIKPISQGSSIGVQVIFAEDDFSFAEYKFEYGDEIIVEKYIKGREMQIAVLNGKAEGVLEIKMLKNKRFYDYEAKYTEGFAEHIFPACLEKNAYEKVMRLAEKACKIFECNAGIIRIEFIYNDEEDKFYILELNTHPGMTPLSICPEIVSYKNISYTQLVQKILDSAKFE